MPHALSEKILNKKQANVVVIRSINAAEEQNIWKTTSNDKKENIRSLIALPINTWGLKSYHPYMFGILYITSNKSGRRSPFNNSHVEQAAPIADILSCSLLRIMEKRKEFSDKI